MFRKTIFSTLIFGVLFAIPLLSSHGAPTPQISGVWLCEGSRADPQGNLLSFPVNFVFHNNGTMVYSSGSKIDHRGYNDRGGALGEWKKVGPNLYQWSSAEITYFYPDNLDMPTPITTDNFKGQLFVKNAIFHHDPESDTLCSGRAECPSAANGAFPQITIPVIFCNGFGTTETCGPVAFANTYCYRLNSSLP